MFYLELSRSVNFLLIDDYDGCSCTLVVYFQVIEPLNIIYMIITKEHLYMFLGAVSEAVNFTEHMKMMMNLDRKFCSAQIL